MKSLQFFFFIAFSGFILSCDKNDAVDPIDPPVTTFPYVKTVTEDSLITTYTYDDSARVVEENYSDGWRTVYTYETGKAIKDNYNTNGNLANSYTYLLNSKGLCTSFTNYTSGRTYNFEYNDEDRIVYSYSTSSDGSVFQKSYYTYENGNMFKDSTSNIWNDTHIVYFYEYYTDINSTIGKPNFGIHFWGKDNKNAFRKVIRTESLDGPDYYNYTTPVLNNDSLVIQKSYSINNGGLYTQEYTYY